MRKGLLITLLAGAMALLGLVSSVSALAPTLGQIPDIIVGDAEDNGLTGDNNIFVYPDALDLSTYVTDPKSGTAAEITWRFALESDGVDETFDYTINGLQSGDTDITDGGADLSVTFRNETVSPVAGTPPFANPVGIYERIITLGADNGVAESTVDFGIKILDDGMDGFDAVPPVIDETFVPGGYVSGDLGAAFSAPAFSNVGGVLKMAGDDNMVEYGYWNNYDSSTVTYEAGSLYKATFTLGVSGQASQTRIPGFRVKMQHKKFLVDSEFGADPGSAALDRAWESNQSLDLDGPRDVVHYFCPSDISGTGLSQEFYLQVMYWQFATGKNYGTIEIHDVVVEHYASTVFDTLNATTIHTDDDFTAAGATSGWEYSGGLDYTLKGFNVHWANPPSSVQGDGSLMINCSTNTSGLFMDAVTGFNKIPPITTDKLYKVSFKVRSNATTTTARENLPSFRITVNTEEWENTGSIRNYGSAGEGGGGAAVPGTTAEYYSVFFAAIPTIDSAPLIAAEDTIRADFNLFQDVAGFTGIYYVEELKVEEMDQPML